MTAQSGRTFRLYVSDGGSPETWLPLTLREKSVSHSVGAVDDSGSARDGFQRLLGGGRRSVSLSGSGIAKGGGALKRIKKAIGTASLIRLKAENPFEEIIGDFHVGSFEVTAVYKDAVMFSASFQSAGAYQWNRFGLFELFVNGETGGVYTIEVAG